MAIADPRVNRFIEDKDTRVSVGLKMPQVGNLDQVMVSLQQLKQLLML